MPSLLCFSPPLYLYQFRSDSTAVLTIVLVGWHSCLLVFNRNQDVRRNVKFASTTKRDAFVTALQGLQQHMPSRASSNAPANFSVHEFSYYDPTVLVTPVRSARDLLGEEELERELMSLGQVCILFCVFNLIFFFQIYLLQSHCVPYVCFICHLLYDTVDC